MNAATDERELEGDVGSRLSEDRERLLDAAHRCADLLVRSAFIDRDGPTWPAWELGPDGRAVGVVA